MELTSKHDDSIWLLTNIYAPCTPSGKPLFLHWLKDIQMPPEVNWLLAGDFNLIRKPADRNKPGEDLAEMLLFNEALIALGVVELPLHGQRFTWSNKQLSPLLERLDCFFTLQSWTNTFPNTFVSTLTMETSDNSPCLISIKTTILKGKIFRFENYLMEHEQF